MISKGEINLFNSNKAIEKPENEFHEYTEKLKCEKKTLHCKYISCISIGICIWMIVSRVYDQEDFVSQLEFASTVASIILSVIAIIMSITGEGKTEGIRNQMTETTMELKTTVTTVRGINSDVSASLEELKKGLGELQNKIDQIPDSTVEKWSKKNASSTIVSTPYDQIDVSRKEWSNINE